ncbi:uncharacterized protein SOCE26_100220 [Sorangium cellulosum]|uniref:Uncharacterized protein n=1 Tax=Sorangium cellulosum TaxID=56 RepID=A0A2L0FA94_SORCE|nr:hypothetical protein [Sorangium cellulosum]AUX48484.1 uncharacterized protein SOCE26_100220 [Sorangium cellulosum]
MHTRKLGPLLVSALGLGCMGMSDFYGPRDEPESIATIRGVSGAPGDLSRARGRWRAARLREQVHASGGLDVRPELAHRSGATGSPSRRPTVS